MKLDKMHHIAIQVSDIKKSVDWYKSKFACKVDYCDSSWALLKFAITEFGVATPHRDGTSSVYIEDLDGNTIEMLKL